MKALEEIRREISAVDAALAPLLAQRLRLADEVAAAKRALGKPIDDPAREQTVLDRVTANVDGDLVPSVRAVYAAIFTASKDLQRTVTPTVR